MDPSSRRRQTKSYRLAVAVFTLIVPAPSLACTLCGSARAVSMRERLVADGWWWNALALALPLVLLVLVVAVIAREPAERGPAR